MRLHLGAVPISPDFVPDSRWKPLRECSPARMHFIALPLGTVVVVLLAWFWFVFTPLRAVPSKFSPIFLVHSYLDLPVSSFLLFVAGVFGLLIIHELLHAVLNPLAGCSHKTVLGFWPSLLLFYNYYDGELSRNRFIAIALTPFIVLSLVPLTVATCGQFMSGWAAIMSCINALGSSADMLGAGMLLFQVPRAAVVRNKGWKSYWRQPETTTA
ncbi:MAG TPA: DUF3267 domain-containing protein [Verrucomicrobiae bacterium]|nr:DUF3267 domain-containing protein [Verrucomicrobiae bacterium]